MGAKQSSPSANSSANGRTRAYSGSDLPSATSSSSSGVGRSTAAGAGVRYRAHGAFRASGAASSSGQPPRARARSAGGSGGPVARAQSGISIPSSGGVYSSPESGGSSPEEAADRDRRGHESPRLVIGSLPAHLSPHLFGGKWDGALTRIGSVT
ncbi:hypothetical protein ATANTOWER_001231 [Ataeniobius toweri]|uniref:Uncharacterized protein n=1 Tax=Ataeniobius toweri TaxID=208326 RepID=A0ABU7A3R2_9TELE|nr:hypothetical protein [Ataeniobius toweri]